MVADFHGAIPEGSAEEGLLTTMPALGGDFQGREEETEEEECASTGGAVPAEAGAQGRRRPRRVAGALAAGLAMALGLSAAAVCLRSAGKPAGPAAAAGDVREFIGRSFFGDMAEVGEVLVEGVKEASNMASMANESFHNLSHAVHEFQHNAEKLANHTSELVDQIGKPNKWRIMIKKKLRGLNATQKAKLKEKFMKKYNITSWNKVRPEANLTDGNPCPDGEEEFAGLCYSKCATLTGDRFPFRMTAFTCCAHEPPCSGPDEASTRLDICGGYDTSGSVDGCAHVPGSCLLNEEMLHGWCYKSCALITFGILPHRNGPATCCNNGAKLAMLDSEGCDTDAVTYNIGGGKGYSAEEPREAHRPIVSLVES